MMQTCFMMTSDATSQTGTTRSFYVTASVNGVELQSAMLDWGSSINIISLAVLDAVGIPREWITRQPVKVSSFRGHITFSVGFVNLDITIGLTRTIRKLQVIKCR